MKPFITATMMLKLAIFPYESLAFDLFNSVPVKGTIAERVMADPLGFMKKGSIGPKRMAITIPFLPGMEKVMKNGVAHYEYIDPHLLGQLPETLAVKTPPKKEIKLLAPKYGGNFDELDKDLDVYVAEKIFREKTEL